MNPSERRTFEAKPSLSSGSRFMVRPLLRGLLCCLLFGFLVVPLRAQTDAPSPGLSADAQISLITILPGDPVYTFAGHSALRVHDPANDIDRLYNYGTFDFGDPFFIPKFTYGYLRYALSVRSYEPMMTFYRRQGRPVIEQPLNLSRAQQNRIAQFLRHNARPENRYYQYDFFFDNCSTRIRDVLRSTLGDRVDFSGVPRPQRSFRELLDPFVASRPALDLGFDLALGPPADRHATAQEVMFLPTHLLRAFEHATIRTDGREQPLVARTDTVQWISGYDATEARLDWPFYLSLAFLVGVLAWTVRQAVTNTLPSGWGDAGLLSTVGLTGLLICYLWFISTYEVTDRNLNLLWAWPTHLWGAYLLARRPTATSLRLYLGLTAAAAGLFVLGAPLWPQNLHHAVPPFVAAVGIRAGWWASILGGAVNSERPTPEVPRSPSD
jgi:hypothetical protein